MLLLRSPQGLTTSRKEGALDWEVASLSAREEPPTAEERVAAIRPAAPVLSRDSVSLFRSRPFTPPSHPLSGDLEGLTRGSRQRVRKLLPWPGERGPAPAPTPAPPPRRGEPAARPPPGPPARAPPLQAARSCAPRRALPQVSPRDRWCFERRGHGLSAHPDDAQLQLSPPLPFSRLPGAGAS